MGRGERDDSALGCGVSGLADLAVEGGDGGGVNDDAALAIFGGIFFGDGLGSEPDHIEGADEVDVDGAHEGIEAMGAFAARDFFRRGDAGAVDQTVQVGEGVQGSATAALPSARW